MRARPDPAPPGMRLIDYLARLVPFRERRAWKDEWAAELGHAWDERACGTDRRTRLRLTLRALGALPDALEMRRRVLLAFAAMRPAALPVFVIVAVWILAAMVLAMRQALDYRSTARAIAVCVVSWLVAAGLVAAVATLLTQRVS